MRPIRRRIRGPNTGVQASLGGSERTSWELHREPVWLDSMRLEKIYQNAHVHIAILDHLAEDEALRRSHG